MAVDEKLVARIRAVFRDRDDVEEKRMFGGIAFMVSGHMCCGPLDSDLMVRVGPDQYDAALSRKHATTMEFTGKPMRGFVTVKAAGLKSKRDLSRWIGLGLNFVESLPPK